MFTITIRRRGRGWLGRWFSWKIFEQSVAEVDMNRMAFAINAPIVPTSPVVTDGRTAGYQMSDQSAVN